MKMDFQLEKECLKGLIEGDHKSFDLLFLHYYPRVKTFLYGFIKNKEEANDLAQEIFYRIWINRESFSFIDSFGSYLFRMVKNLVYDQAKHKAVRQNYLQGEQNKLIYEDLIEDEIYAKELELLIDMVVANMPDQRRKIFLLSRKEGFSNDEIAQKLEINKRTVENHITNALSDIRKVIKLALSILV